MIDLPMSSALRSDGLNRRGFLKVGSLGLAGLTLPRMLRAEASARTSGQKAVSEPLGHLDLARWRTAAAETYIPNLKHS